jgi:hypothetical protein
MTQELSDGKRVFYQISSLDSRSFTSRLAKASCTLLGNNAEVTARGWELVRTAYYRAPLSVILS